MRTSKIAALVAVLAGGAWVAVGAVSWNEDGLTGLSEQLWWGGLGAFALASALTGYAAVTTSPIWLRALAFLGAAALGTGLASSLDTDVDHVAKIVAAAGVVLFLAGLLGLFAGRRRTEAEPEQARHGRRAAR